MGGREKQWEERRSSWHKNTKDVVCCRFFCVGFFAEMGELARKPGCPELPDTPLGLLTPRPGEGFNIVDRMAAPVLGVVCGVGIFSLLNTLRKRPAWAGLHMHIFCGGIGYVIATMVQKSKFASRAERDAVFKHYISLHPEDFPPFERQRFADVYYPFKPIR